MNWPGVSLTYKASPVENEEVLKPEALPNIIAIPSASFAIAPFVTPTAGIESVPLLSASFTGITLPEGVATELSKHTTDPVGIVVPVEFLTVIVKDSALSALPATTSPWSIQSVCEPVEDNICPAAPN